MLICTTITPATAVMTNDIHWYRMVWYADASKTQVVGYADGYCDGGYEQYGQQTEHYSISYFTMCP